MIATRQTSVIKDVTDIANYMENRYQAWGYRDDMVGAGLEAIVRRPQPTRTRELSCARFGMLDELRKLFFAKPKAQADKRYVTVYVDDVTPYMHNGTTPEAIVVSALSVREWFDGLTPMQKFVTIHTALGYTQREIAEQRGVDESRVSQVLRDVRNKWEDRG